MLNQGSTVLHICVWKFNLQDFHEDINKMKAYCICYNSQYTQYYNFKIHYTWGHIRHHNMLLEAGNEEK